MDLELVLQRRRSAHHERTPGELRLNAIFFGYTLEDEVRELAGQPVASWKVHGQTAIPAGRYRVTLEASPRFGPDTITIQGVEGFTGVRFHAGNDEDDTEGCPLGGYVLTPEDTIAGGMSKPMIENLKRNVRETIARGGRVFIDVRNPA